MTQIDIYEYIRRKAWGPKAVEATIVQCTRKDCEITARTQGPYGPWLIHEDFKHVMRGER